MSRPERVDSPTGIYHVMQRGVGKQIIFESENDYKYYIKKLKEYKGVFNIDIISYCLMENHVHLLVKSESCNDVSRFVHRIGTSYALYYNGKYSRTGHVFQGRYACEIVGNEKYLMTCVRYIHNNPVKAGISTREDYRWSSYCEYLIGDGISDTDFFLSIIGGKNSFVEYSNQLDDTKVMDCDSITPTLDDALEIIRSTTGIDCIETSIVKGLSKDRRDSTINALKKSGFTCKEIERMTGVSRAIIYHA